MQEFQNAVDILKWHVEMGVDEAVLEHPVNRFDAPKTLASQSAVQSKGIEEQRVAASSNPSLQAPPPRAIAVAEPRPARSTESNQLLVARAKEEADKATSLDALRLALENFEGCDLKKHAKNTVFSDGNPKAGLMLIGEAPGGDEDRAGKPFVGESGQLLDRMMAAILRSRETDFYIANIVPWRPLGNRKPTPEEQAICLPFMLKHIQLVEPKALLLLGNFPSAALLNSDIGITKLRGNWHTITINGKEIPALPTYHPAYLLRQPAAKRDSWKDLLALDAKLREISH